jgi:hypothetical protein
MVTILRPCCAAKISSSGSLAMLPSSFMISQMTPAGFRPASRARSTQASVCPVRRKTPPSLACKGKRWPGVTISLRFVLGSMRVCTVVARSKAEMPVVMLARASTDTVNAVPMDSVFWEVISWRDSSRSRSAVMGMQIRPRAKRAIKLMASGVTFSAAIIRSPSFSRFSSSNTMIKRPDWISEITSSTEQNGI